MRRALSNRIGRCDRRALYSRPVGLVVIAPRCSLRHARYARRLWFLAGAHRLVAQIVSLLDGFGQRVQGFDCMQHGLDMIGPVSEESTRWHKTNPFAGRGADDLDLSAVREFSRYGHGQEFVPNSLRKYATQPVGVARIGANALVKRCVIKDDLGPPATNDNRMTAAMIVASVSPVGDMTYLVKLPRTARPGQTKRCRIRLLSSTRSGSTPFAQGAMDGTRPGTRTRMSVCRDAMGVDDLPKVGLEPRSRPVGSDTVSTNSTTSAGECIDRFG